VINPLDYEWLRWAGAAILSILLIFGAFIIFRYPQGKHSSISRHIASNPLHYVLMALLLTIGGGVFYAFLIFWLIPTYHISTAIYYLLALAFAAQLTLAWVPDKSPTTKLRKRLHIIHYAGGMIVASVMAICLYFLCAAYPYLPPLSLIFVVASTLFSTICIILYVFFKQTRQHFLIYEIIFIALFSVAIFSLILGL
jgi:hypothetical protein